MKTTYPMPLDAEVASLKTDLAEQNANPTAAMQKMFALREYKFDETKNPVPWAEFKIYEYDIENPEGYSGLGIVGLAPTGGATGNLGVSRYYIEDKGDGTSHIYVMPKDTRTGNRGDQSLATINWRIKVLFIRTDCYQALETYSG